MSTDNAGLLSFLLSFFYVSFFVKRVEMMPIQDDIATALRRYRGMIPNIETADTFLKNFEYDKDNAKRFLCWMLQFAIIPVDEEARAQALYECYDTYQNLILKNEFDKINPLDKLSTKQAHVVKADVDRSISQFDGFAKSLGIADKERQYAKEHVQRIIAVLTLEDQGFVYTQSYDRFFFVCYLLCLEFTINNDLPPTVAEAWTYFLAPKFIHIASASKLLGNPQETEELFKALDAEVKKYCPKTTELLEINNCGSIHYALHWQLVMFVDQYDINSLLYLWDQIIVERKRINDFMKALCIAHVMQVPEAPEGEIMVEKIQFFKGFDVRKAVKDARAILNPPIISKKNMLILATVAAALAFVAYISFKK